MTPALQRAKSVLQQELESYKASLVSEPQSPSLSSYELSGIQMLQLLNENQVGIPLLVTLKL